MNTRLSYKRGRYILNCAYRWKHVPKRAGFYWDAESKHWYTTDITKAEPFLDQADETVPVEALKRLRTALSWSQKVEPSSSFTIPAPEGHEYYDFQKVGILYAHTRPNTLNGDVMGLGKTVQAIGQINADMTINHVLVVCQAAKRRDWEEFMHDWLVRPLTVSIMLSADKAIPNSNVIIVGYETAAKWAVQFQEMYFDLLVVDECQYVKNKKTKRAAAVLGIDARKLLYLSGTAAPNRPIELFRVINRLDKQTWPSEWEFRHRYLGGWAGKTGQNLDELQRRLRSTIFIRREKDAVKLPPKLRQIIRLPAIKEVVNAEASFQMNMKLTLDALQSAVETAKVSEDEEVYGEAVRSLRDYNLESFTDLSRLRHQAAVAKIPYAVEHIQGILDQGVKKLVVFAHHKDVLRAVYTAFKDVSVLVTGDTPMNARHDLIHKFTHDPSVVIFFGSLLATGTGINLQAAAHVVFLELDWVPGNMTQAEDRCHRIGQQGKSVLIQHLVVDGSIDARIAKTIIRKQEELDKMLKAKNLRGAVSR